jgi:hypothetical protein
MNGSLTEIRHKYFVLSRKYSILHPLPLINWTENALVNKTDIKVTYINILYQLNKCYTKNNNPIFLVLIVYRMGEQSPYTWQCAVQLDHLHTSWLHVQQIRTCTFFMATQSGWASVSSLTHVGTIAEKWRTRRFPQLFVGGVPTLTLPFILPTRNCRGC